LKLLPTSFFAVFALSFISACTSPYQRIMQEEHRKAEQRAVNQQQQVSLEARCRGYGFELKTPGFAQCMMKLDQADRQTAQAQSQRRELESRCELAQAQGLLAPTSTGSFGESAQRGAAAYNACMAGLPPPATRVICQRQGPNEAYCFSQ
jgi:hypothetical protein